VAGLEDVEARVTALESQVRKLTERVRGSEQDAAAARVLAGGADRDVGAIGAEMRDFRQAATASFNAMREDLVDLRRRMDEGFAQVDAGFAQADARFAEIGARFTQVGNEFARVDQGFMTIRGRLDAAAAGQQQIVDLLTTLIADKSDK
jgi:hypothetical protein